MDTPAEEGWALDLLTPSPSLLAALFFESWSRPGGGRTIDPEAPTEVLDHHDRSPLR